MGGAAGANSLNASLMRSRKGGIIISFRRNFLIYMKKWLYLQPFLSGIGWEQRNLLHINKNFCEMAEYLEAEKKQEIFAKYGKSNTDTGSPESQVALFSYRINHLTEHVKKNKKDVVTRRSLLRLVGKRRQILDYLQKVDIERYRKIVKELGLRR